MPKGAIWSYTEKELISEHAETKTINELCEMLPGRSKKAIYRMIEKLRDKGSIGYKKTSTRRRSNSQCKNKPEQTGLDKDTEDWGFSEWE